MDWLYNSEGHLGTSIERTSYTFIFSLGMGLVIIRWPVLPHTPETKMLPHYSQAWVHLRTVWATFWKIQMVDSKSRDFESISLGWGPGYFKSFPSRTEIQCSRWQTHFKIRMQPWIVPSTWATCYNAYWIPSLGICMNSSNWVQSAIHIFEFHVHWFNWLWIKISGKKNSACTKYVYFFLSLFHK
jgi:hypothetical protein